MKEKLEFLSNSFKNGIILWLVSLLSLYVVGVYIGDTYTYNLEILKLLDVKNFILQLLTVGFTDFSLELVFSCYCNSFERVITLKSKTQKEISKEILIILIVCVILIPLMIVVEDLNIINKSIIEIMFLIIFLKAIIFCIAQVIRTIIYNKKIREKNQK